MAYPHRDWPGSWRDQIACFAGAIRCLIFLGSRANSRNSYLSVDVRHLHALGRLGLGCAYSLALHRTTICGIRETQSRNCRAVDRGDDRRRGVDYLYHKISSCGEYFHEVEAFHAVEINRHLMFIIETRSKPLV